MSTRDCQEVFLDGKKYIRDETTGELLEVLCDRSSTGKKRPWRKHKVENQQVEKCYRLLAERDRGRHWEKYADRLRDCGVYLFFRVHEGGRLTVKHANSCCVRLCPVCAWRRSVKIRVHMRKILEQMEQEGKYAYLMLTLTVPNIPGEELSGKLDEMMRAWSKLERTVPFQKAIKGWYRGLEITHNLGNDTYHPHFHCLLAVNPSYFRDRTYICHEDWLALWQRAMKDESITQVDIRKVKPRQGDDAFKAVCEVTKYAAKTTDYVMPWDWEMSCQIVEVLDRALHRRRLVAFGGRLKKLHKQLNLDDEIDGDLTEGGEMPEGEIVSEICAVWHVGYQQYIVSVSGG